MAYPGGKAGAGVYQRIINQIPPHDVYVEPFLGDGAILRRKRPATRTIGVEIDPEQAERFAQDLADESCGVDVEIHRCCGIEWLKHAFDLYRLPSPANPAATAAAARSSGGGHSPGSAAKYGGARAAQSAGGAGNGGGRPAWFVYLDPPYLLSTRRSGPLYRYEMTEAQHVELLDVARRLPCAVAISGYWSPLYASALQQWRHISFNAVTRGGKVAREFLWMNHPEPAELHDYRYLGDEKRERERIARKVRTWSAGLRRLHHLERLAIVNAITIR